MISAGFHQAEATAGATATKNGNFNYERGTIASLGMTARTPTAADPDTSCGQYRRAPNRHQGRYREAIRRAQESRGARTSTAAIR